MKNRPSSRTNSEMRSNLRAGESFDEEGDGWNEAWPGREGEVVCGMWLAGLAGLYISWGLA